MGRLLVAAGLGMALLGALVLILAKLGFDALPGDVVYRRGNFTLYVPLGLMIVLSIVLTILLNLRR